MSKNYVEMLQARLEQMLPTPKHGASPKVGEVPELLSNAMRYSLLQGGKRLRPMMMLSAVEMFGGDVEEALPYACAIEMIHCYSLIHDDLPGMDNDQLRRGQPTNHVVFGIGQAILAGDGLLTMAFETMYGAALNSGDARVRAHMLAASEIARGAGVRGMVAGQSLDLFLEKRPASKVQDLQFIQDCKTAALFIYALRAAGRLCGADEAQLAALEGYGRAFGLLFQTVDDLLDDQGDEVLLGKRVGKDREIGKLTAVSMYGPGGATALKSTFLEEAHAALDIFGEKASYFHDLIEATASRTA